MKKVVAFAVLFFVVGFVSVSFANAGSSFYFFKSLFGDGDDFQNSPAAVNTDPEAIAFFEEFKAELKEDKPNPRYIPPADPTDLVVRSSTLDSEGVVVDGSQVRRASDNNLVSLEEYFEEIKDGPVEIIDGGIKNEAILAEELQKKTLPLITEDTTLEELELAQEEIVAQEGSQDLDDGPEETSQNTFVSWIKRIFKWE